MNFKSKYLCVSLVISFLSFPAFSAESTENSATTLDEIIVTARKREESLLDIAESITAISGSDIDTQDQSIEVGKHILKELRKDVRVRKKTPREAEFAVLKSTSIASVLIETSYLSNKEDEKFLINPRNQDKIAEAIVRGLKSYSESSRKNLGKR